MKNIVWAELLDKSLNLKTHSGDYSLRIPNLDNLKNGKILDLSKILSEKSVIHIIENKNFKKVKLENKRYDELFEIINFKLKTVEDVEEHFEAFKSLLKNEEARSEFKDRLNFDFDGCIEELRKKLQSKEKEKQKVFKNLNDSKNEILREKGVWPLYLGFGLIRVENKGRVAFYAPLVLKKIDLEFRNNNFFIIDKEEEPFLNKKINYIIKKNLDITFEINNFNTVDTLLNDLLEQIKDSHLKDNNNLDISEEIFNHYNKVKSYKNEDDKKLISKPFSIERGAVLGIFLDSTIIHEKLKELQEERIAQGRSNEIINFESNNKKNILEKEIFKIIPTNLSQQKAIIQSLNQNTIIIGPPGTGKTQTIANLITNIMIMGKRALIISEKQEALTVLLDKLETLSQLCFFGVENSKHKKLFYKYLNKLPKTYQQVKNFKSELKNQFNKVLKDHKNQSKKPYFNKKWDEYYTKLQKNFQDKKYKKSNFLEWYKWNNFLKQNRFNNSLDWFNNLQWDNVKKENIKEFKRVICQIEWFDFENIKNIVNEKDEIFNINNSNLENVDEECFKDLKIDIKSYGLENKSLFNLNKQFINFSNKLFSSEYGNYWKKIHNINHFPQSIKKLKDFFIENLNLKLPFKRAWFTLFLFKRIHPTFKKEYKIIRRFLNEKNYNTKIIKSIYQIGKRILNASVQYWSKWKEIKDYYSSNEELTINETVKFLKNIELKYNHILDQLYEIRNLDLNLLAKVDLIKVSKVKNSSILFENFNFWINNLKKTKKETEIKQLKNHFLEFIYDGFRFKNFKDFFNQVKTTQNKIENKAKNLKELNITESVDALIQMHDNNKNSLENFVSIKKWELNEKKQNDQWIRNIDDDEMEGKIVSNLIEMVVVNNMMEKIETNSELKKDFKEFLARLSREHSKISTLINKYKKLINKIFPILIAVPENLALIYDWKEKVDFVIFDESSQVHTYNAIPFLSKGKNKIIVGDGQQMQPTNWFSLIKEKKEEEIEEIESEPSLLQYTKHFIDSPERTLSENYRSEKSSLMYFSSQIFYEGKLNILSNIKNKEDAIEVINVNGEWINQTNIKEAYALLERVSLELQRPENKSNKFIILTFNSKQLKLLKDLIYDKEEYNIIQQAWLKEEGNIKIITSLEKVQGDEADIIFMSLGYDASARLGGTYIGQNKGKNALNVSISRAKKKNIIFKSIYSDEISSKKESLIIFKQWLEFIELKDDDERKKWFFKWKTKEVDILKADLFKTNSEKNTTKKEFKFELKNFIQNEILNDFPNLFLEDNGKESTYEIDFIIRNRNKDYVLGIDAFYHKRHLNNKIMEDDFEKYKRLSQSKYPFYTIREIYFYNNKKTILNEIKSKLKHF